MELYTNFYKILLFMKMYLPSSFILRYVRAEMNVQAFMNELDQKDYCISCYFREGFIFANFASQTLAKISTSIHVYL